jgi:hypothetical protein
VTIVCSRALLLLALGAAFAVGCRREPDLASASTLELVRRLPPSPIMIFHPAYRELDRRKRAAVVADLVALLRHEDASIRDVAARAIGWLHDRSTDRPAKRHQPAVDGIVNLALHDLLADREEHVRAGAVAALVQMWQSEPGAEAPTAVIATVRDLLASTDAQTRVEAASGARWLRSVELCTVMVAMLATEPDSRVRFVLTVALDGIAPACVAAGRHDLVQAAVERLTAALDDPDATVRLGAAMSIGSFPSVSPEAVRRLQRCLVDEAEDQEVRIAAAEALAAVGGNAAEAETLLQWLLANEATYSEPRWHGWIVVLGKAAAAASGSDAARVARQRLHAVTESTNEEANLVATASLARIAIGSRDADLGTVTAARLGDFLSSVTTDDDEVLMMMGAETTAIEAMVDLACWPEGKVDRSELRRVLEAMTRDPSWSTREWATRQLARLE